MAAATTTVSSSSISPANYDVFLSFRGEENFTSYLYKALTKAEFRTFLGDGDEVSINRSELDKAIRISRVFIIVFSANYGSSSRCLDDLVMILKYKRLYGRRVLPVFLNVDPSHVRHQTGSIGEALEFFRDNITKQTFTVNVQAKIREWREATTEAGYLSGYNLTSIDPDPKGKFSKKLVEGIVEKVKKFSSSLPPRRWSTFQRIIDELENAQQKKTMVSFDWENAPQRKTMFSPAQITEDKNRCSGFLAEHYDKSSIIDNKQLMMHNLLQDVGKQLLPSSKILNPSNSNYLWRTPLVRLILKGCASLVKVSEPIGLFEKLTFINLEDCKSFKNLPSTLPCLETLIISGCSNLEFTIELGNPKLLKEFHAEDTTIALLTSQKIDCMKTSTQAPRRFRNVYSEPLKLPQNRKMKVALSPDLNYAELKQKAKVVKQNAELLNRIKDILLLILSYPMKPEATVDFESLVSTFSAIKSHIRELEADKIDHQSNHEYFEFLVEEAIPLLFQQAKEFFINSDFDMVAYLPEDIVMKTQSQPLEFDVSVAAKSLSMPTTPDLMIPSANRSKFEEATMRPDDILPTPPEVYTWAINFAISQASRYVKDSAFNSIAISGSGGNIVVDVLIHLQEIRSLFDLVLCISVSQHQSHRTIEWDIVQQINIWKISIGSTEISMPPPKVLLRLDCIDESINLYNLHIPNELSLGFPIQVQTVLSTQSQKAHHIMPVDLEIRMEDHLLPWNLFCRNIGQVMDHSSDLQHIAVQLIEACHGHLLAIILLGKALKGETNVAVWELALHELTSLQSSSEAEGSNIVMAYVLKFIWERKDTVTKHCIKKCSTSQTKGTKSHKDSLVSYWIADSLIEKQQQGEDVLEDLINSFLLENVGGDFVRMREEIRLILLSSYIPQPNGLYLKLGNLELTEPPKAEEWDTKEIHLMNNKLSELPDNPKCPVLTKLFLQSNYDLSEIPNTFFEYMPVLQVLDLSNTSIKSLDIPSISRLVELQELLLRGCELLMELPPQIGALRKLKVFDLEGTELLYLPKELSELINLECLKVSLYGCADSYRESKKIDAIISRTTLSKLTQLKELSIKVDPYGEWWNIEVKAIFEELPSLRKLETLELYVPTELLQQFVQLEWNVDGLSIYANLSHFRLIVGSQQQRLVSHVPRDLEEEFLKLEKCLKYINGEGNANHFAEALKHANALFLDCHWSIKKLSAFKVDELNELKDCLLVDCNEMRTVFDGSDFYEGDCLSLQNLHIYYLKNLELIWKEPVVGSCVLPHLKILALHMCPNLTTIVTPMLLQNLAHLEEIIVEDCPKIETLVILDPSHSTLSDHSLQSLKRISLLDLPDLVNIFSGLCIVPKLEMMNIYNCPKLKILSSVEVCNKKIIKSEWWDALECNEPERSSAEFFPLALDQLVANGYSLRLFLKDLEAP